MNCYLDDPLIFYDDKYSDLLIYHHNSIKKKLDNDFVKEKCEFCKKKKPYNQAYYNDCKIMTSYGTE